MTTTMLFSCVCLAGFTLEHYRHYSDRTCKKVLAHITGTAGPSFVLVQGTKSKVGLIDENVAPIRENVTIGRHRKNIICYHNLNIRIVIFLAWLEDVNVARRYGARNNGVTRAP